GFISNGYLQTAEGEYLNTVDVKGITCALFRVSYKDKKLDTSYRLLWIDPKTKIVVKREEYSQMHKLNGTFWYLDPKEVAPGIWFPTRLEAYNRDNQQAGVTLYRDVRVNQGLDDSVFRM
ncbi:MAG TPA: outer membrane lipoprotein-sorting protein, partial [Chthonomonadaceae bacterium]|nr:outer membrane lipoprotein-sorting protein [Chthonomonadaceae bacterium]